MTIPIIPRQVLVRRTENIPYTHGKVSKVEHYDNALSQAFPLFLVADPQTVGRFTESLSQGFSEGDYGPFWPSFASVNAGTNDLKVLWLSEAALQGLRSLIGIEFYFQIEDRAQELIDQERTLF